MQTTVNSTQALGVIGEFFDDSPQRCLPANIVSGDAANNVFGRVFTWTNLGNANGTSTATAAAGGTGTFAGILVSPKEHASNGTAANGSLAATLAIPNYTIAQLANMGSIVVQLDVAATQASALKYINATGAIAVGAPGAGETAIPNAKVVRFLNSAAGIAVIQLTN
jgi:hypothetical protein